MITQQTRLVRLRRSIGKQDYATVMSKVDLIVSIEEMQMALDDILVSGESSGSIPRNCPTEPGWYWRGEGKHLHTVEVALVEGVLCYDFCGAVCPVTEGYGWGSRITPPEETP